MSKLKKQRLRPLDQSVASIYSGTLYNMYITKILQYFKDKLDGSTFYKH